MRTTFIRLFIAAVLGVAAWLSWSESQLAMRVAEAKQDIATLNHDTVDTLTASRTLSDYLPGNRRRLSDEISIASATVSYWLGRYDAVAADTNSGQADAEILLAAANAAFRDAQRNPAAGPAAVQRLDGVLQAYASAMKASDHQALASAALAKDAAYNYEFVARLRDQVARLPANKMAKVGPITPATPMMGGDLPLGPTVHGAPGAPPPDARMEDLQTIAPMEYGDREAQPNATPGGKKVRKG